MTMPVLAPRSVLAALATVAVAVPLSACGGGSSKPGYCQDKQNLTTSIQDLSKVDIKNNGLNALESQLQKVRDNAKTLVASAKDDFPSETGAIDSAIKQTQSAVSALPSNPSAQQIAAVGVGISGIVSAVKSFDSASKDKCS